MYGRLLAAADTARAVVVVARDRQVPFLAASIAYYAFVSLVPLSLLALVVATTLGGSALAEEVTSNLNQFLTPTAEDLVADALTGQAGRGGATVVGTVVLLWSGLRVFRGLDTAFSTVYGTAADVTFLGTLRDGFVVLFTVGFAVVAVTAVETFLLLSPLSPVRPLSPLVYLALLVVAFYPLYAVFPDVAVTPREALPGALLAALGWTALGAAFQLYAQYAAAYALYGLLGAVLLVLSWLYVGAQLLLLGAVLNAVLAGRVGDDGDDGRREAGRGQAGDCPSPAGDGHPHATDRRDTDRHSRAVDRPRTPGTGNYNTRGDDTSQRGER